MKIFANRIKILREKNNITLKELAKAIGCTPPAISYWENNKKEPTAKFIRKIAILFNVTADYLLGLEDEDGCKIEARKPEARNEALINNSFNHNSGNFNIDIKK